MPVLKSQKSGITFPDSARYEGDFLNGQFHGQGVIYGRTEKSSSRASGRTINSLAKSAGKGE